MRTRSVLAPACLGAAALMTAALVGAPNAAGGGFTIAATSNSFTPENAKVDQGMQVTWTFQGLHTSTSDQQFWNSGQRSTGETFSASMSSSGRFPYHCTLHSGMDGRIAVPMEAAGAASTGWTLRWSGSPVEAARTFDVQYRRQGSTTWRVFRNDTTAATGHFDRTRAGTYQFRARTTNTAPADDLSSGWSPVLSREIT